MPPLLISSLEQRGMVVIVAGHTLFVTSQCDVFTVAHQRFGEAYCHNMHIILYTLLFLVVAQCVAVMNINFYQRSKLGDRNKTQYSTLGQSSS